MQVEAQEALAIVHGQAEDEGLWFEAVTSSEDYLQRELRRLHAAVEKAAQASPQPSVPVEAQEQPAGNAPNEAWLNEIEERLRHWRQPFVDDLDGDNLGLHDLLSNEDAESLVDTVCSRYGWPVRPQAASSPTGPASQPEGEPMSSSELAKRLRKGERWKLADEPSHPEPQVMKWSALELAAIRAYGERCWCAGRNTAPETAPARSSGEVTPLSPDAGFPFPVPRA